MRVEGRCLCGAVTFAAAEVESGMHICHCSICRRWTGGPTFSIAAKGLVFQGEENIQRYSSSARAERGFCKTCGSSLFYRSKETDQYVLGMGVLDEILLPKHLAGMALISTALAIIDGRLVNRLTSRQGLGLTN